MLVKCVLAPPSPPVEGNEVALLNSRYNNYRGLVRGSKFIFPPFPPPPTLPTRPPLQIPPPPPFRNTSDLLLMHFAPFLVFYTCSPKFFLYLPSFFLFLAPFFMEFARMTSAVLPSAFSSSMYSVQFTCTPPKFLFISCVSRFIWCFCYEIEIFSLIILKEILAFNFGS